MTLRRHLKRMARERVPEGVLISSLPQRQRWLLYAAYPGKALRYLRHRFDMWTVQPGEVWEDFLCDRLCVITTVKPTYVKADLYARFIWDRPELIEQANQANDTFARAEMERWRRVR